MDLRDAIGLGVAGNTTGHLEQAGEAGDFAALRVEGEAPKGIFPFYVPGASPFLGVWPCSSDTLRLPPEAVDVQIEPEVALVCALDWADGTVRAVRPVEMAAFDDASIRRPAPKISLKKNWGPASKGLAADRIPVTSLGAVENWRLASFLIRDGELHEYGVDSPLGGYTYFGARLLDWLADRFENQVDEGPLECVRAHLEAAGRPRRALVSIGATNYTPFGQANFVRAGDEAVVVVYDGARLRPGAVRDAIARGERVEGASLLRRRVIPA